MQKLAHPALTLLWAVTLLCFLSDLPRIAQAKTSHVPSRREASVLVCLDSKRVPLLTASDAQYADYSSPYNVRLQYRPLVIILAATTMHVSDSVLCAAKYNLKVQAKSGGHSYASHSTGGRDGAVIIDLQQFQNVTFNTVSNIATFGPGVRLGNLELALRPYGRALPHGTCTGVGAGGHFSIGGDGFMSRAHGLAIDALVALDVVMANGSLVHATPSAYPDVFFAMRGAGPSFGIVTAFYGQTIAHPKSLTGIYLTWPGLGADSRGSLAALTHLQNFANNASSGLDRNLQFDVSIDSTGLLNLKGIYLGPVATFNRTILPELIRGLPASAAGDDSGPAFIKQYGWTDALLDANYGGNLRYPKPGDADFVPTPDHDKFYTKSLITPALPVKALRNLATWAQEHQESKKPAVQWYFTLSLQGGYDNQIFLESKQAGAAFWRRNATWVMENSGYPSDSSQPFPVPAGIKLVDDLNAQVTDVLGRGGYGAYQGYVDSELSAEEAGQQYYGDALFAKLQVLKRKLDPGNVFSNPQTVPVGK